MTPDPGNGRFSSGGRNASLVWGLASDPGPSREHNEDFAAVGDVDDAATTGRSPIFAVADGLGGHAAGEVASRVAIEAMIDSWNSSFVGDASKSLRSAARAANTAVLDESRRIGQGGMGTTLTALTVTSSEVLVAHVGDSRAYRVQGDSCVQLTADHSRVGEMLRMKLISPEQAAQHPARSQLTRSLGSAPLVQIDLVREQWEVGDSFIICSDGVWDEVGNADMAAVISSAGDDCSLAVAASQLVSMAIERGSPDNVTAVVVTVTSAIPLVRGPERRSLFRRRS